MTNPSSFLPVWSIRTDGLPPFSFEARPHEDIAMGRPLPEPPLAELEIVTYDELVERDLDDDERTCTLEELAERSMALAPLEYDGFGDIWSSRLVAVTRATGADNLETWPIRLVHRLTGRHWDHVTVNVLGRVGVSARKLESLGLLVGRDEDSGTLLLADPVKRAWETLGLGHLHFMKQHPRLP